MLWQVDYREFFDNMMKSQHETLREPKKELAEYLSAVELEEITKEVVPITKRPQPLQPSQPTKPRGPSIR